MSAERLRQQEGDRRAVWRRWGPYVSERQWGTVREDYSADGNAWDFFPFRHAVSRAYRWGEDGLAAICDEQQRLCLGPALWNRADGLLKERLFGLTNGQGNHGEDVKELYWYVDATPTASYLKCVYKYPHAAFPYDRLIDESRRRSRQELEYELIDTGVLHESRYFDVEIEYAKAGPTDVLMRVTATNRGPEAAPLDLLIQAWFRNTWTWEPGSPRPRLRVNEAGEVVAEHEKLGAYALRFDGAPDLLFCDNDSNLRELFGNAPAPGYFKDGINKFVVHNVADAVNPARAGTKMAARWRFALPPGGSVVVKARLTTTAGAFADFDAVFARRIAETQEFYDELQPDVTEADARLVQRQALAGLVWSKQFYYYDVPQWLAGDPGQPAPPQNRREGRNSEWGHLNNADVVSMPDKWEYPWYAAWDLSFHVVPFALIDVDFAKKQLVLLLREWYMHPNGQMPAYEWNFADVNPPVHAWAAWRVYQIERHQRGSGDVAFLERVFHKLLLNFTWWVNRKDARGRNLFQGGFLGLDNVGVFNRSTTLPSGVVLDQADGTSWMATYCLNLLRIALELSMHNPVYQDVATKFFEHFLGIAEAMTNLGGTGSGIGLWDEGDGFFYDHLNVSNDVDSKFAHYAGKIIPLKVRSIVGLIPMFAVETLEPESLTKLPHFAHRLDWYLNYRPELAALVSRWNEPGRGDRRLLSLLRGHRLKALLRRMLDEDEFLSPHGIRSLSRAHLNDPYVFRVDGTTMSVGYVPGESDTDTYGGSSNWRGPIWLPVNFLLVESLRKFHHYYGDDFKVECPTRSGNFLTLDQVADELTRRLASLFLKNNKGERPIHGDSAMMQKDAKFSEMITFYEHFHGDTGRGLGATHQTGWTALIASLLLPWQASAVCDKMHGCA